MEKLILKCEKRNLNEKTSHLRKNRLIPRVVYWHKQENINLKIDNSNLLKIYRKAWKNHVITLSIEWKDIDALFHDIQFDPVKWDFLHIDFYAISKWEKVHTKIPLIFVWNSKAKSEEWAIIEELIKELEVKCLATDLVNNFEVDLSKLEKTWDTIKISDIKIPSNFEILHNLEDIVAVAAKAKTEKEKEEELKTNEEGESEESKK